MSNFDEYKKSEKIIDLHSHTDYSDGQHTPIEVLNIAIENKVGTLAITDHDTVGGIRDIRENYESFVKESGIELINGIELTAKVDKGTMHILGYGIDIYNKELNDKLIELKNNSMYAMVSYLNELKRIYGIKITTDDIKELFNIKGNLGRPHLARILIKEGYSSSVQEAFDKYLIDVYERVRKFNKKITYKECIELIKNAGGIAVLAHPYTLKQNDEELINTIENLIDAGLDGIEVYHSNHSIERMEKYMSIVNQYNLLYSGGSDFHGHSVKPYIDLGYGKDNNLNIKELSILRKLKR